MQTGLITFSESSLLTLQSLMGTVVFYFIFVAFHLKLELCSLKLVLVSMFLMSVIN